MKYFKSDRKFQLIIIVLLMVVGMGMFSELDTIMSSTGGEMNTAADKRILRGAAHGMKKIVEAHWQGMEVVPLTWELAAKLGIPLNEKGALVDEVTLTAAESGLMAGDVITSLNGIKITNIEEFYLATRRLKNQNSASITARRGRGRPVTIDLVAADELGFAQLESAPMVLPGAIPPHRYRGPCTDCHEIGTTGELTPDPDNITLSPPAISKKTKSPHRYRGKCKLCHTVR